MMPNLRPLRYIISPPTVADTVKRACVDHASRSARIVLRKCTFQCKVGPLVWTTDQDFASVLPYEPEWTNGIDSMFHYRADLTPAPDSPTIWWQYRAVACDCSGSSGVGDCVPTPRRLRRRRARAHYSESSGVGDGVVIEGDVSDDGNRDDGVDVDSWRASQDKRF